MKNFVILCGILLFGAVALFAQDDAKPYQITGVENSGDDVIIKYYHMPIGDEQNAEYEVSLSIYRESNPGNKQPLRYLTGNIGEGKFVGNDLFVRWQMKKQFPKGLPYDDMVFELTINKISNSNSWVWYAGGAVVVGGGAAAYFLLKKKPEEETKLPDPPLVRP